MPHLIVSVSPLFNDKYLQLLNSGKKSSLLVIQAYFQRLWTLATVLKYDRIVIEKELFPFMPALFEWILYKCRIKYIVDYDDAIFHNYDQHSNYWIKAILQNKISDVMKYSYAVVAGNSYLASKATQSGALNVTIIPTVVDLNRYKTKIQSGKQPLIIGWIGTKSTFEKHLAPKVDLIKKAMENFPVEFRIVGVSNDLGLGEKVNCIPWFEATEVDSILQFDIGIMPLEDSLWEKGKCSYKLIQYMACGLPVIASPIGMNKEVVKENLNGFLAYTDQEWLDAIGQYVTNRTLRTQHGLEGQKMVAQYYCLEVAKHQIIKVIRS